jgi:hypothetical protein
MLRDLCHFAGVMQGMAICWILYYIIGIFETIDAFEGAVVCIIVAIADRFAWLGPMAWKQA